jgi:hypothetical protein
MLYLRGVIEARSGDMRGATATLLEAADASSEPSLTLEILAEATQAAGDGDPDKRPPSEREHGKRRRGRNAKSS